MNLQLDKFRQSLTELLDKGVADGVYPGAVLLVAQKGNVIFFQEVGYRSIIPQVLPMRKNTIFDLASLTKPLAAALALMRLIGDNRVELDQTLSELIKTDLPKDKKALTLRSILSHCAGFRDWRPFYLDLIKYSPDKRKKALREMIMAEPLHYPQGTKSVYSDLGFMVLEWVVESLTGETMREFVHRNFYTPMGLARTYLYEGVPPFQAEEFAATEDCPWRKRIMRGEVHDENAYAAGGYSGHAGLFGTAEEIFVITEMLMENYLGKSCDYFSPGITSEFFRKQGIVKGSTWALGWDTPSLENSSAGKYCSAKTIGHLGFTGTSLWIDLEREITVVFLTNRIHPNRGNLRIRKFRPILHDLIFKDIPEACSALDEPAVPM